MTNRLIRRLRAQSALRARQLLRLSGVRRVRRVVNGVPFVFPLEATNLAQLLPWERVETWEEDYSNEVLARVRPGDQVVDIGAFVGIFTLLFADRVGSTGKVIACEPNPQNRAMIAATLRLNELPHARVVPYAVSDKAGTVRFSLANDESSISTDADGIEVECTTLDALVDAHGLEPDVVKVDVEGFEPLVLDGAARTLPKLRMICAEVHPRKMVDATNVEVEALLTRLTNHGFRETFRYEPPKHLRDPGRPFNVIYERDR